MSSAPTPRRSARVAAAAAVAPTPTPPSPAPLSGAPAPPPTKAPDTRPRCRVYLEVKKRMCNRISCDGTLAFCADHLPAPPSSEQLDAAHATLADHLREHPLSQPVEYDWNNRDQFAGMRQDHILALMNPHKEVSERLWAVYRPLENLYTLCKDLKIDHPFVSLYTEMNRSAYAHWSTYDLLEDYLDDIFKHGYIAGNRGYDYYCRNCIKYCDYTSADEPKRYICPACT